MEITNIKQLKNSFQSAIDNSANQKFLIENELNGILNYVNTIPNFKPFKNKTSNDNSQKSNVVFELKISNLGRILFNEAFYKISKNGKFEISKDHNDTNETFAFKEAIVKQANEFSEYYSWINSLLNKPQKSVAKIPLSHKQKLLALHYLGLNTTKYENTKIAKVLAEVLELSEDNTRIFLSYLSAGKNEVRTKANLEKVNQLFEKQGLSEISDTIINDIKKL